MHGGTGKEQSLPRHRWWKAEFVIGLMALAGFIGLIAWGSSRCVGWKTPSQTVAWGSYGQDNGQFNGPGGITVNTTGHVYVVDNGNNRVQVFTPAGQFVTKWGSFGIGDGQFNSSSDIAVNASGYVYVLDNGNHRVQVFTPAGQFVAKWGQRGSGNGNFSYPGGIAVNETGYVYVADSNNQRVQVFASNGTFIQQWGELGCFPRNIAINSSGYVFLTILIPPFGSSLLREFTSTGQEVGTWSPCEEDISYYTFSGVAVDSTGHVFVTEHYSDRVLVVYLPFERPPLNIWFFIALVILVVISAVMFILSGAQFRVALRNLHFAIGHRRTLADEGLNLPLNTREGLKRGGKLFLSTFAINTAILFLAGLISGGFSNYGGVGMAFWGLFFAPIFGGFVRGYSTRNEKALLVIMFTWVIIFFFCFYPLFYSVMNLMLGSETPFIELYGMGLLDSMNKGIIAMPVMMVATLIGYGVRYSKDNQRRKSSKTAGKEQPT